jgi:hypothetical protein
MSLKHLFLLTICLTAPVAYAQQIACPGVERPDREQPGQLLFTLPPKAGKAYYYAKALTAEAIPKITAQHLLKTGVNLTPLPDTRPQQYQLPDAATKLYILNSAKPLQGADAAAQIQVTESSNNRNATIYASPLPPETESYAADGSMQQLNICEQAL